MLKRQLTHKLQGALEELPKSIRNPKWQRWVAQWSGLVQPLWIASRIKINKMDPYQLEIKIPLNALTHSMQGSAALEESFLMLSANQGFKFFLLQMQDRVKLLGIQEFKLEVFSSPICGPLKFRMQLSEMEQEALRSRLHSDVNQVALVSLAGAFYSKDNQMVANCEWTAKVQMVRRIRAQ